MSVCYFMKNLISGSTFSNYILFNFEDDITARDAGCADGEFLDSAYHCHSLDCGEDGYREGDACCALPSAFDLSDKLFEQPEHRHSHLERNICKGVEFPKSVSFHS